MDGFRKYYLEMARKELAALNAEGLEMIRKIIADLAKDGSEYSARTSAARLEEMRREKERAKKEEQAREAWKAERRKNTVSRYERNETMRILGQQTLEHMLNSDPATHKMYEDLLEAEKQAGPLEKGGFAMDLYAIGYIGGIRSERQRKKIRESKVAPVQQEAKSKARTTQAGQGQGRKEKADK